MNILTFDIEEWALAKSGGYGTSEKYAEYDEYLDRILDLLDHNETQATIFCTGQMAEFFPTVVKKIHSRGHEIGCHSYRHTWMNKMTESEAREDTRKAVDLLEQCIGDKILSYRAPAFSIGENNKWMFEILAENGITRDASIFPAKRDFGGFPVFQSQEPCTIVHNSIKIKEFPIGTTSLFGKTVAYSGGGYFRLFPYSFIEKRILKSDYSMCYFHINDLTKEKEVLQSRGRFEAYFKEPGTLINRYARLIKTNLGKATAWNKLTRLLSTLSFHSVQEASSSIDWDKRRIIQL